MRPISMRVKMAGLLLPVRAGSFIRPAAAGRPLSARQRTATGRQPAARASASVQNQRRPLAGSHPDAVVPGAPGHVVDLAVRGDVALDGAAFGRRRLRLRPALCAVLPRRRRLALPDADALRARFRFLLYVALRVAHEGPGQALAHHPRVDVLAAEEADGERAAPLVEALRLAAHGLALDHAGQRGGRFRAAGPSAGRFAAAGLPRLGSVDALQPYARFADGDGVAVDDPGETGDAGLAGARPGFETCRPTEIEPRRQRERHQRTSCTVQQFLIHASECARIACRKRGNSAPGRERGFCCYCKVTSPNI
jgi:hypothetical protein